MTKKNNENNKLSKEQILHLALLVRLELEVDEIEMLEDQLEETIDYVQNLGELDTTDVKELSHSTDAINVFFEDGDEADRTFSQEDAVANANETKGGYFIVSKILDK